MEDTRDSRRHPEVELQLLTISDPAARANMMRHMEAYRIMLTGHRHDARELKVLFGAGFGVTDASEAQYQRLTMADGNDRLFIRFDVDDAAGPPDGLGLFRKEGDRVPLYGQCRLWCPPGEGRPVIVFYHEGSIGYFTSRPGETLSRVDGLPSRNILPGYQRADRRLARLVASERLRDVGEPYVWSPGYDG